MILVMLSNTLFRFEVHCNKKYIKTSRQRQKVKIFKKHFSTLMINQKISFVTLRANY